MTPPIHIVAVGARTAAGMQAAPAAAALRAGVSVLGDHPFMVDQVGEPMPAAIDAVLDPRLTGPKRLLPLAETALRETLGQLDTHRLRSISRLPVYLGLPEVRPGFTEKDAEAIRIGLSQIDGLPVKLGSLTTLLTGHAAGLAAIATALVHFAQGQHEACLVGGVDSYFHPDTMEWLDANRQLVGSVSRSGFVPGEGAGFCLLMTGAACERMRLRCPVRVRGAAVGRETKLIKTTDLCFGEGLTATIRDAIKVLGLTEKINHVICDMNGERYRGEEWGFVCLRLSQYFDDPTAYQSPADCWGDVGAASGPLFAMLVCNAVARGHARGGRTLLWAGSEGGQRAAVVLEAIGLEENGKV